MTLLSPKNTADTVFLFCYKGNFSPYNPSECHCDMEI